MEAMEKAEQVKLETYWNGKEFISRRTIAERKYLRKTTKTDVFPCIKQIRTKDQRCWNDNWSFITFTYKGRQNKRYQNIFSKSL